MRVPFDLDHPHWIEDPDFDLEFHVRHIALPKPGDWRQLCIQAARLIARPLDLNRPLWEFYVIEGLEKVDDVPPGSFAIVSKVHHAAIDGMAGMDMTSAVHELRARRAGLASRDRVAAGDGAVGGTPPRPGGQEQHAQADALRPGDGPHDPDARTGPAPAPPQPRQLATAARAADTMERDSQRAPGHRRVPLPADRAAPDEGGRRGRHGQRRGADHGGRRAPPVPHRQGGAARPVARRDGTDLGAERPGSVAGGNMVSGMLATLGTDIAEPLARLEAVRASTHNSKEFAEAVGARTLIEYAQLMPGGLVGLGARTSARLSMANRMRPIFNTTVTNMPGPQQPLYLAGAQLVSMYGIGMIVEGMGLIHPVMSYCGDLTIAFTSCREMLPDPAFYASCIRNSFEDLAKATA